VLNVVGGNYRRRTHPKNGINEWLKLRKRCLTWSAQDLSAHGECCAFIAAVVGTIVHAHVNAGMVHLRGKSSTSPS
jgi:hypothetical protein